MRAPGSALADEATGAAGAGARVTREGTAEARRDGTAEARHAGVATAGDAALTTQTPQPALSARTRSTAGTTETSAL